VEPRRGQARLTNIIAAGAAVDGELVRGVMSVDLGNRACSCRELGHVMRQ
jgi:hypothetical protein